jgi:dephospho-CoA kinase
MTLVFGLTGGLASGKSTVAALLRDRGIAVIDADVLAREVVEPGTRGLRAIVERFGEGVLGSDGRLDRARLGERVFGNPQELAALNAIVHPRVHQAFLERVEAMKREGTPLVGYEVPLLFENRLEATLRPVVLVATSQARQVERALARDGHARERVLDRLRAQLPLAEKLARADLVIWNDGNLEELRSATEDVARELQRRAAASSTAETPA